MSVAFRRESDEEHLEPKFELPIPLGPNLVTARGLELLETKVAELEAALPALTDEVERKAHQRDLRYWRTRLATAELKEARADGVVGFGCRVDLVVNGKPRTIELIGHDEADPAVGKLAFTAPLCRAVMGAEVGDVLDFGGKVGAVELVGIGVAENLR
ncbi:GreA/GreB family elongation factor [Novosphingobium sp.]|uniref:GreA/GreB family elongation factor n=1 Tax=Novosphingobium sp. TaxID=1874826 RepID=UPI00286CBDE7|nr:GreA/GreB family elongation factor [Novosphingobium sp.]